MIGKTLAGAAAALALSTVLAAAAPAALERSSNVRAGPGTNYPVIARLPAGAMVDVGGCTGSWCQVNTGAGAGYVARSLLAFGGGGGAVAVAPGYGYYDDDYYDYGYGYGPSVGVFVGPNYRHGRHWRGHDGRRNWAGRGNFDRGNWSGRAAGVNIPSQRQSGAAVKSFGGRSTVGASPSVGARGSVRGGAAISSGRGGSVGGGAAAGAGGGGGASVGGRGGFGLSGRP
jgi:uncharacterized protein YraI